MAALKHKDFLNHQIDLLISEREKLYNALSRLPGFVVYPSETNFLLVRTPGASAIHEQLKQSGILIKNLDKPGPLKNCLRVTIGTPQENKEFLKKLIQITTD